MFKRFALLVLGCVAGCGEVASKQNDAAVDSPKSIDAAIDSPTGTPTTAIGVHSLSQFTAPNATFAKVPYGAAVYDDAGEWDASTSTFKAKVAGDYLVCAGIVTSANNFAQTIELDLFKNNGSTRERGITYGIAAISGCTVARLAANDTLDVRVYQGSGNNITFTPDANWDWLKIERVTSVVDVANTAQKVWGNNAFVKIAYASEAYDTDSQFEPSTSTFTATQAGDYLFCPSVSIGANSLQVETNTYVNDVRTYATNGYGIDGGCGSLRLAANDTVDGRAHQQTGSSVNVGADTAWDKFVVVRQPISVSSIARAPLVTAAGTPTKIPYNAESFDTNGEFDVSTSTFTAKAAGDYLVCASVITFSQNENEELNIYKNGARTLALDFGHNGALSGCTVERLAVNDQIQAYITTISAKGGIGTDPVYDRFQVSKLR
jgi:hypothetical protein